MGPLGTHTAVTPMITRHPASFGIGATGAGAPTNALVADVLKNTIIAFIPIFGFGFPEAAWRNLFFGFGFPRAAWRNLFVLSLMSGLQCWVKYCDLGRDVRSIVRCELHPVDAVTCRGKAYFNGA